MIRVFPAEAVCVPESDREELLIAELTKTQFQDWAKENNPAEFFLEDLEKRRLPVAVVVPSRDFIAVYTKSVESHPPIASFRNRPGDWKLKRVVDWYSEKHYQVVVR